MTSVATGRVLVLGGTAEGRRLASALAEVPGLEVVYSLAGRVGAPALPAGVLARVGGFGGPAALASWLRSEQVGAVVDATHPFAATMTASAVAGCAAASVPLLVLRRPGWTAVEGDSWYRVPTLTAAASAIGDLGERVFLSTGRSGAAAFAPQDRHWFLLRSVEAPVPPLPPRLLVLLERGPFTLAGETALLRRHRVDVVVTKDSGGSATAAKLTAARALALPVVLVDRPQLPPGARVVATPEEAVAWVTRLVG